MPHGTRKNRKVNAHSTERHGEPKVNNKPTKISKHKRGYKKRK